MINKNYLKYLFVKNRKFLILFTIIFLFGLPLTVASNLSAGDALSSFQITFVLAVSGGFIMAFICPLYLYHFMNDKRSSALYFSLPIKKDDLFITQFIFSLCASILPVLINYLLTVILISITYTFNSYALSHAFYLVLFMAITNVIVTFVMTLSHNTLDSLVLSACYFILPVVMCVCGTVYLENIISTFTLGTGSYTEITSNVIYYLSLPGCSIYYFIYNNPSPSPLIYWCILSIILFNISKRLFYYRDSGSADERTTSFFGYPLVISVNIFSFIFAFNGLGKQTYIAYLILLVVNMVLYFFSIRKIKLNYNIVLLFMGMVLICIGSTHLLENTKCFNKVHEYMDYGNYRQFTVQYGIEDDYGSLTSSNSTCKEDLKNLQKELIDLKPVKNGSIYITIEIEDSDNAESYRTYYYSESKEKQIKKIINQFKDDMKDKDITYSKDTIIYE